MMSVLDIFKPGIGPSSSHTVGPMKIARDFADRLGKAAFRPERITVELHGSLALTGRGHCADDAVVLGLAGFEPESVDIDFIPGFLDGVKRHKQLRVYRSDCPITFDWQSDIRFLPENLPLHENGILLAACGQGEARFEAAYYSTGGGFFRRAEDYGHSPESRENDIDLPYDFKNAEELIALCDDEALSISGLMQRRERALQSDGELASRLDSVWQVMKESMARGISREGLLPGPLKVPRRAVSLWRKLQLSGALSKDPMVIIDWVNMFAFAVSEENASGGRVVTAPTNGACGVVPAVLAYYDKFVCEVTADACTRYFLTAGAVAILYQMNASISGAEVGCQGEIGVACSMAAAGLAELMGGSPNQVCAAAEIAMEHCLGLTCDPVEGLVQIPCIERNAIFAVKAINAARMALARTTAPRVSLDKVIQTMYETGRDMNYKYRETAQGGLAKVIYPSVVKCE